MESLALCFASNAYQRFRYIIMCARNGPFDVSERANSSGHFALNRNRKRRQGSYCLPPHILFLPSLPVDFRNFSVLHPSSSPHLYRFCPYSRYVLLFSHRYKILHGNIDICVLVLKGPKFYRVGLNFI